MRVASDPSGDEFVEIVNPVNGAELDLGGWSLGDNASSYHTFAPGTLLPRGASLVVVAGAPVEIPGLAIDGTTWGSLSGAGDDVYLRDELGDIVSRVSYTGVEPDISFNRSPDADPTTSRFAFHYEFATGLVRSSPGRRVDGTPFPTPEPHGVGGVALARCGFRRELRRAALRGSRPSGSTSGLESLRVGARRRG